MRCKLFGLAVSSAVCFCLHAADAGIAANAATVGVGEGEKAYVDAYADNVHGDKEFKAHENAALATIHTENRLFDARLAILPPLIFENNR